MRFLLINTYSSKRSRLFKSFRQFVIEQVRSNDSVKDTEDEFFEVDVTQLETFLFDPSQNFKALQHVKNFDLIDIVLIAGESPRFFLDPYFRPLMVLLKMCILVQKPMFVSGLASRVLASLINSDLQVFSAACGTSSSLRSKELIENDGTGYFYDLSTGDLFRKDRKENYWKPEFNLGIRHREFFVSCDPKVKKVLGNRPLVMGSQAQVRPESINNFLCKGVGKNFEFRKSEWETFPVTPVCQSVSLEPLVLGSFGSVVSYNSFILSLFFDFEGSSASKPYVANFLRHHIEAAMNGPSNFTSIKSVARAAPHSFLPLESNQLNFRYSGFTIRPQDQNIAANNSISARINHVPPSMVRLKSSFRPSSVAFAKSSSKKDHKPVSVIKTDTDDEEYVKVYHKPPPRFRKTTFHYDIASVEEARSKPIVSSGSPYETPFEVRLREEKLSRTKFIQTSSGKNLIKPLDFYTASKVEDRPQEFINSGTGFRPSSAHQFRTLNKQRWISKKGFFLS